MKAITDLTTSDVELIHELGSNAQTLAEYLNTVRDALAETTQEKDAADYMRDKLLAGILILQTLKPID